MAIIRNRHAVAARRAIIRPSWVVPGAVADFDFVNNRWFGDQWLGGKLVCVRASTADYIDDVQGVYRTVGAAIPRISNKGLLIEKAATNVAIQNRDLSNAAWVKVNTTGAKDQTGVDGVANSASSVTATSGNGTILQTDVLGSSSRMASTFVKRITGSGTVNMTTDGATFTAITVTSNWTRVNIPAQTVTNPITGFQIVTSGDVIAVDLVQNETGPIMTSPIATAAAAVTRSVDNVTFSALPYWYSAFGMSMYAEYTLPNINTGTTQTPIAFDDGTANQRVLIRESGGSGSFVVVDGGVTQASLSGGVFSAGATNKSVMVFGPNDFRCASNGSLGNADVSGTIPVVAALRFGDNTAAGTNPLNGYLRRVAFSRLMWSNGQLKDIST